MNALERLRAGGVVGGGGAGFPLYQKLAARVKTLLINAAECEPLLRSDQYLMLHETEALLRGAEALRALAGAEQCVLCLKEHYREQRRVLREGIERLALERVSLKAMPAVYPIGDEQAVVYEATARAVPPLRLPSSVEATVVSVSTAINAYYAQSGVPVTHRYVTVAGCVLRPGVYHVPVGMPVSELLEQAGGCTVREHRVFLGGPMMGTLLHPQDDAVVTKTCGGVLVFPAAHVLVRQAELPLAHMRNRAKAACIQCRTCTDLCPRYLLGHPIAPHLSMRAFAMGRDMQDGSPLLCMECGVCELYACPMSLSPRAVQRMYKEALRGQGARPDFAAEAAHRMRGCRQVPTERLMVRIDVSAYAFDTPAQAVEVTSERVRIPLRQHIGVAAAPCVAPGERVRCGDTVGRMAPGALGADVHASIDGVVERVDADAVVIGREAAR